MKIVPTINFDGKCAEAIHLYEKAFGGEIRSLMTYRDANDSTYNWISNEQRDCVYHSELYIGGERINMCDNFDVPFTTCSSTFLALTVDTKEEVLRAFELMKEGCKILYPPEATWYSSCRTSFIDRFGIRWSIMTEQCER